MNFLIGAILPFLTVVVFVGGVAYRLFSWNKHASPPMTLYPAPETSGARSLEVVKEVFFFKRLFYGDKMLWFLGGLFHVMLLVTFLDHYDRILAFFGLTAGTVFTIPYLSGGPTGLILLGVVTLLLLRRITVNRVAQISTPADYLVIGLILAVV
ncbi:MAG: respiratory nitrate reductase subunit gamma, partial [Planctomycetota bacterium]